MDIKLGKLDFALAKDHPKLLSASVAEAISKLPDGGLIGVAEIDPNMSDTAAFCAEYEVGLNQVANCVILEAKRAERSWYAGCSILGSTRADVNGLARKTLDARKVSFAPMERAVSATEMEYGAISPIGLPTDWMLLVDRAVADSEYVIVGSGIRKSKLAIPGKLFSTLPNVKILDGLGSAII
ncbi:MAG: YbaK/EbsC family protein [Candidatus Paceibacterota bacterium]|jgi:prolyl-tRNA editing enzyme YbaK/EbsC (Cys-tRNA(Pro) deacylase)